MRGSCCFTIAKPWRRAKLIDRGGLRIAHQAFDSWNGKCSRERVVHLTPREQEKLLIVVAADLAVGVKRAA